MSIKSYAHFVRDFYQFLESARMKFSFTTNYLIQEPETKAYILSENGILMDAEDRIVLEDSTEFLTNETIKGQTSGVKQKLLLKMFVTLQFTLHQTKDLN